MASRVFLSSTFVDLAPHRTAVQGALRQLGAVDVSMEHFGARDERPAEECVRLVREESDLFVGLYAHRYGHVPEGNDRSICQLEYDAASDAGLPRFIYLVDEKQPWLPSQIDQGDSAERLKRFKDALKKRHMCQFFGSEDQLATKVVADVGRHLAMLASPQVGPGIPVPDIGLDSLRGSIEETPDAWNARRNGLYTKRRGLSIAHVLRPSKKPGQVFDVFIYLIRHKSVDLSDVRVAEFFLGPYWESKIFPAVEQDGFIGIATAAYGPFICLCRVTFEDGEQVELDRYIDFEAFGPEGAS